MHIFKYRHQHGLSSKTKWTAVIMPAIFYFGVLLLLQNLLVNRSLWLDEGLLSINLLHRNFAGLAQPLDKLQAAPLLFLWAEKLALVIFGNNDYALRIFPFILSVISLYIFGDICIRVLGAGYACICTYFMFTTCIYFLRYGLEVKQYECDVLVTLYFLWQLVKYERFNSNTQIVKLLFTGCTALWLSHIAVMVLFSTGLYLLFKEYKLTRKVNIAFAGICLAWAASFAVYFVKFELNNPLEAYMLQAWEKAFVPHHLFSFQMLDWIKHVWINMSQNIIPYYGYKNLYVYLWPAAAAFSLYVLIKKNSPAGWFVTSLIFFHLAAAWFKKYPFTGRFLLYILPLLYLAIGAGAQWLAAWLKKRYPIIKANIFAWALATPLLILFIADLFRRNPVEHEEIKKSFSYISNNIKPGQLVFVSQACRTVFDFYQETGVARFSKLKRGLYYPEDIKKDSTSFEDFKKDLNTLKGEVWLLYAHMHTTEEDFVIRYLQTRGTLKQHQHYTKTNSYLFVIP